MSLSIKTALGSVGNGKTVKGFGGERGKGFGLGMGRNTYNLALLLAPLVVLLKLLAHDLLALERLPLRLFQGLLALALRPLPRRALLLLKLRHPARIRRGRWGGDRSDASGQA